MNERQASAQEKLSKQDAPEESSGDSGLPKIEKGTFFWVLGVAGVADLLSVLCGWLTLDGGLIQDIFVTVPATTVLVIIYIWKGVKFNSKNVFKIVGCDATKIIPLANMLPTFILNVVLTMGPLVDIGSITKKIPGGEIANKVQNSIANTRR